MNRNGSSGAFPGPEEASARPSLGPKAGRSVPHFDGDWISAGEVKTWVAASNQSVEQAMFDLVPLASTFAKPTLSGFKVGAVAQGTSGALYLGANVEFPECAVNQTVHAEQAAVINAWLHQDTGLSRLAVSAAPCGYCRQFLFELATADQLEILLAGQSPQRLATLLPGAFGPRDLGVAGGLLNPARHKLYGANISGATAEAALEATTAAYAPYTGDLAGAAVRTQDGRIFRGAYLENAAFNLSLSPLQVALVGGHSRRGCRNRLGRSRRGSAGRSADRSCGHRPLCT